MIGPPEHTWMINLRVSDLDAMVEQLRAAGVGVEVDPETYPNGRFAQTEDPEGNRIQLWQPTERPAGAPGPGRRTLHEGRERLGPSRLDPAP